MRRVLVYLIIGIFFGIVSYLLLRELSPFNMIQIQELIESEGIVRGDFENLNSEIQKLMDRGLTLSFLSENAYIVAATILASIFCIFVAIHLVIDKVFLKNFYERANHFDAIRRGLLLIASLAVASFAKLSRAETYVIILIFVVAILAEVVFVMYFRNVKKDDKNILEEEELDAPNEPEGKHISYEDFLENMDRFGTKDKSTSSL